MDVYCAINILFGYCGIPELDDMEAKKEMRKVIFKDGTYIIGMKTLSCWWHETFSRKHLVVFEVGHTAAIQMDVLMIGKEVAYPTKETKLTILNYR